MRGEEKWLPDSNDCLFISVVWNLDSNIYACSLPHTQRDKVTAHLILSVIISALSGLLMFALDL